MNRRQLFAGAVAAVAAAVLPKPKFATGGLVRWPLRIIGERGPELEAVGFKNIGRPHTITITQDLSKAPTWGADLEFFQPNEALKRAATRYDGRARV